MTAFAVPRVPSPGPVPAAPGLATYQLRLPSFEGPLDVLLRLVEREHLPIAEVSLVSVTDQFLAHLAGLEGTDAGPIAGFTAVAGRLLLLKSRSLLPRPSLPPDEREPDDLVRQLAEYRQIRDAAQGFAQRDRAGLGAFPRGAVAVPAPHRPRLATHPPHALARALRRRLVLLAPAPVPAPLRVAVTLDQMLSRLGAALRPGRRVALRALVAGEDREHLLVGFLAVLVLLRRRLAEAEQAVPFGDISIAAIPGSAVADRHEP